MPALYIAVGLAIVFKIIIVSRYRTLNFAIIFLSFFKIYSVSAHATNSKSKKRYMFYNNAINIFLYASLLLFLTMLFVFRENLFNYS